MDYGGGEEKRKKKGKITSSVVTKRMLMNLSGFHLIVHAKKAKRF